MATVPYVTESPWWSAANLNTLCAEFDRRLTKALAGKTPYLLGKYGACNEGSYSASRVFHLPISQTTADATVDGVYFPEHVMGAVYAFSGTYDSPIYFARTGDYDQDQMDTDAAAASETSRDTGAMTMVVDDSGADLSLEWSLKALTRTDGADTFWLVPSTTSSRRAMRKHRYAVAEIVLEAYDAFTVPREWDRYANFRLHNLSKFEVTVTVETYNADGTDGDDETITLPKFGCRSFRREPGYYDDSLNYMWVARAGIDKRFYEPSGAWVLEASAHANNIANPNVIAEWLEILGAERDPNVAPPDEWSRYSALFGDPSEPTTLIHDLIAHKGAAKSIGFESDDTPVETSGTVGDSSTLVADMAAMGVTVTTVGDTYELDRVSTGGPGEDSKGLDLFCSGSNLLWVQADTVTVPGHAPFARAEVQRQYTTLPVTLVEDVPVGTLAAPGLAGFSASAYSSISLSRTLYGSSSTYGSVSHVGATGYSGSGYAVTRLSEIGDAGDSVDGPYTTIGDWQLTPLGFAALWSYSFTFTSTLSNGAAAEPMNGGVYQEWSGAAITRASWIHLQPPGWSFGSLKPTRNRVFGLQSYTASPNRWETADWTNTPSSTTGAEPAGSKVLIEYLTLNYLSDGTPATRGDVHSNTGTPADMTETRYQVMVESDEARSAVDLIEEPKRVQYNQGTPTVEAGSNPPVYFHRRPMQIEDYNTLAWMVNGWTRTAPLISIRQVWLKRTNNATYPGLFVPEFSWESEVFPKNAAFYFVPGAFAAEWSKANWNLFVTVQNREDFPGWADAKAADQLERSFDWSTHGYIKDKYVDMPWIMGTYYQTATTTGTASSRHTDWAYSQWNKDDVDGAFGWVTVEDVAALADDYGLPYLHITFGQAARLMSRLPPTSLGFPFDGTDFGEITPFTVEAWSDPPDLSDQSWGSTHTGTSNMPRGFARFVPPEAEEDWEYIIGGAYEVDEGGSPLNQEDAWDRGPTTITGNQALIFVSPIGTLESYYIDDYFPADDAMGLTSSTGTNAAGYEYPTSNGSKQAIGINIAFSGYTDGEVNSHMLRGNQYTRNLSSCAIASDGGPTFTGGSWSYTSTVDVQTLTTGETYYIPAEGTERPCWLIANPYVDLAA